MSAKRSSIWDFFTEQNNGSSGKCNDCNSVLSRSGGGKKGTNSSMINHLKTHPKLYELYKAKETESKAAQTKDNHQQKTIVEAFASSSKWDANSSKAKEVTRAVAEMVILDLEPLRVVEKPGFKRLMQKMQPRYQLPSRKHFTDKVLPEIYEQCKENIKKDLPDNGFMSFTTDIWSSNNKSMISLTGHWLDEKLNRKSAILNSSEFSGSHTGERIGLKIHEMLENWNIRPENVHLILRDNAANMVKGLELGEFAHKGCFIHTLQLVVLEGLDCQKVLRDTIVKARNIVTHFNHSPLACDKLAQIQKSYDLPRKSLVQDVRTRWNSTFYMLERLIEQRQAVTYYSGEESNVRNLTEFEYGIASSALKLLRPFEEITRKVSSEDCCISEVIPYVAALRLYLEKLGPEFKGLDQTKSTLLQALNSRFKCIDEDPYYTFATFVDPRFKINFCAERNRTSMKSQIVSEILSKGEQSNENAASSSSTVQSQASCSDFWACLDEIGSKQATVNNPKKAMLENEVESYLAEKVIERTQDPYTWWRANRFKFPGIAKLVPQYFSAPASTIFSERLFSTEGLIYEQHRNRLLPDNGEMLTCLNRNFNYLEEP